MPFDTSMQDLDPNDVLPAAEMDKIRLNLLNLANPDHSVIISSSTFTVTNTSWAAFQPATFSIQVEPAVGFVMVGFQAPCQYKGTILNFNGRFTLDGTPIGATWWQYHGAGSGAILWGRTQPLFLTPGSYQIRVEMLSVAAGIDVFNPIFWAWWV